MIVDHCQRWRDRRESYRPAREVIDTRRFEVAAIPDDATARDFCQRHHYAGSMPAARRRFGLYEGPQLVGVAVFSQPCNDRALARLPDPTSSLELGRLVLLDHVAANAESWMVSRCFDLLRADGFSGVLSFADPVARQAADGVLVKVGHVGSVYQSLSAIHLGKATPRSMHLLPDGRVFSEQSIGKIRRLVRGWRYSAAILERYGATPLPETADRVDAHAWLWTWLPRLCRPFRHPGNLIYLLGVDRAARRALRRKHGAGLPYPKLQGVAP
jgi:hypothetical protein